MSYRDELEALRTRNEQLSRDLADAQARIDELERGPSAPLERRSSEDLTPAPSSRKAPRRWGTLHYHPPATYVPLLRLCSVAVAAAFARAPRPSSLDSDGVLDWVLHYGLRLPFLVCVRLPLYYLSLCVVLPVSCALSLVGSLPLLAYVVASRVSFSSEPPPIKHGWTEGEADEEAGAMFLWAVMSLCLWPFLLTTTSLLEGTDTD